MAPVIALALQLAQFAPSILRYFGVGEESAQVADRISDIAKAATGATTPEEIVAALKADAESRLRFQELIVTQDQELQRLYYADIADARKRDAAIQASGKRNYRADSMYVLSVAVVLILFAAVWMRPDIPEFVKGIVTLILGRFLGYLDQIFNFEFGSTRDSKTKSDTIKTLVGK